MDAAYMACCHTRVCHDCITCVVIYHGHDQVHGRNRSPLCPVCNVHGPDEDFVTVLSSDAVTRIAVVVVHIIKYISLMPELNNANALEDNVLRNFGGAVENNLNHILGNISDTSEDLAIFTHSSYIDTSQLEDKLTSSKDKFTVFSLNTQSIHAKFNYLYPLFLDLCN